MAAKTGAIISSLREDPLLALPLATVLYGVAFLFLCRVWFYLIGGAADWTLMNKPEGPVAVSDPIYVALAGLLAVAVVVFAAQPARRWNGRVPSRAALFGGLMWLEAGEFLRTVAKPNDRIWLVQGLATGALTDSYLRDPFYAPLKWSKFEDLKTCSDCTKLFDYFINWPGQDKIPPGFEMLKDYSNIALLRRHRDRDK
jgi:hypothetical protein